MKLALTTTLLNGLAITPVILLDSAKSQILLFSVVALTSPIFLGYLSWSCLTTSDENAALANVKMVNLLMVILIVLSWIFLPLKMILTGNP